MCAGSQRLGPRRCADRAADQNALVASPKVKILVAVAILVLLGSSAIVAWRVPTPSKIPTVAWNSPWVFRAETFTGFFIGVYVLLAIGATTIRTGQPPRKLSFGMVSYEEAEVGKAADALNDGKAALQAVQQEMDRLRKRVARTTASARAAHEGLVTLAGDDRKNDEVAQRSSQEIETLRREEEDTVKAPEPEFDRAMARLEQTLSDLNQMLERPRRARRAG
jgi:hypothetical protein